ncbi:aldo/keto reductase [Alteromonas sp. a30]|uniref:aldo/keto reductase n=1 Tax=Alteromonas sp. a30 TaxID=2730917 RepID=UPI00227F7334|nr:aldo/keto reductase [Alteromonas sp. a30]MCY7293893.1 aldo/keto reductase [Alteromonas sp. a30]
MSIPLQKHVKNTSRIAFGCMGLGGSWDKNTLTKSQLREAHDAVNTALESGIRFFDHADIYCHGKSESVFGEILMSMPNVREQIVIQSKCGIRLEEGSLVGQYDASADWIQTSVEASLKRLKTDYLDILLIHRPDPLMQVEEVADVFNRLHNEGKVKHFGVSNMHVHQIKYLQYYCDVPLIVNQLEMSLFKYGWVEETLHAGNAPLNTTHWSGGQLEHCAMNDIQIQAWGSLAQGLFSGRDISSESLAVQNTAALVAELAAEYQTTKEAIVLGWLMRHPANVQPVIGTIQPERIKACTEANSVLLSRNHWYKLLVTARGQALP